MIAKALAELSRAQVQRLIDGGRVAVAGEVATKAGARVRPGDAITVRVPPPEPLEVLPEPIPLVVLYEDAELIVIDKPAGLVVHPAAGHASGTLVNALLHHCKDLSGIGGVARPGIVHRLDKDTTGVMVATKSDRAHAGLAAQFAEKSAMERAYLGITVPAPTGERGTWNTPYGRHPVDRKKFTSKTGAKVAITNWAVEERLRGAAVLRFELLTGRTHQIRVHCADHGTPLLDDPVYGRARIAGISLGRQALHAHTLAFDHPVTGARMRFEAPLPADLRQALTVLRGQRDG